MTDKVLLIVINIILYTYILKDNKDKTYNSEQLLRMNNDLFVFIQDKKNSRSLDAPRLYRHTYQLTTDSKVAYQKFRENRKLEVSTLEVTKIKSMNDQFKQTTGDFLKTSLGPQFDKDFVVPTLDQSEVNKRQKVAVKGGQLSYIQLDRPKRELKNYTREEISKHNKSDDAWTVYQGKVYDITLYKDYHPGGIDKLLLGAGKDCTKLFSMTNIFMDYKYVDQFHSWVNCHAFLEKDHIGFQKM